MATIINAPFVVPAITSTDTVAGIPLGTRVNLSDGGVAVYCQASALVDKYEAVVVSVGYTVAGATTTLITEGTGTGRQLGFAQVTIPSAYYAWIHLSGRPVCKLAADCADRVQLYTTATAGVLDDAVVSIGLVAGVVSKTTISTATAVTLMVPTEAFIMNVAVQA